MDTCVAGFQVMVRASGAAVSSEITNLPGTPGGGIRTLRLAPAGAANARQRSPAASRPPRGRHAVLIVIATAENRLLCTRLIPPELTSQVRSRMRTRIA